MEPKDTLSLGLSPALLAKRDLKKPNPWCHKMSIEFDPWCDPDNPKTITHKEIIIAAAAIKDDFPKTPLTKARYTKTFPLNLFYKFENFHHTGSFCERGALYSLLMLNEKQKAFGVIAASLGNWALALAHYGCKLTIPVSVVLPTFTSVTVKEKCEQYGASVTLHGLTLAECKRQAFVMIAEDSNLTYVNSYDYPHAIAGAGTIGLEILDQLPETDAILVPVGGGGLIAGISSAVKHYKPDCLIYVRIAQGVEPSKCCSFFKAMESGRPCETNVNRSLAESLAVPTAGCNAFHTAKPLIDKMVVVNDDWIARAVTHLVETENVIAEGAGAASISALFAIPDILPELRGKNVVCIITGGNIDISTIPRCVERARAVDGRLVKLTIILPADTVNVHRKVLSIVANVGCNIVNCYIEGSWITDNNFFTIYMTLVIETTSLEHACILKRVMNRLFPEMCEFEEEPYNPTPICVCFPKRC